MPDRPNVLFVCTDQQQATALGAVDGGFRTPNLDRLADRGTLFTGCHTTHPQCSPARSSLVTGQFPHRTGMATLPDWGPGPLDPSSPSVARPFREAGYETTYVGKWHLGGDVSDFGWERAENVHETANPTEGLPVDEATRDRAVEYLSERGDEPFFLTVSFNLPHPAFHEDEAFAGRYDREEVALPGSFGDDLSDKPAFHRERASDDECDLSAAEYREMRYRYRTMVSRVDDHVGAVLDELDRRGLREDTVVVFTSDHGDMQGAHGLAKKGVLAYDEILRVPLIVDVPGRKSRRERVPDLVSLAAVPGTLLDAAGLPTDGDGVEGGSLLPALSRTAPPEDERVFFEHRHAYWGDHPYRGVRTREWKYVEYLRDDAAELYRVASDPHERENRAGDPDHAETEARLAEMVREWWTDTGGDVETWCAPLGE